MYNAQQCKDKLNKAAIVSRWILQGKLRVLSPLIVGGGNSLADDCDIVLVKDENNKPFIPSSSITGALKHAFNDYRYIGNEADYEKNKLWFWGGEFWQKGIKRTCQSAMVISDLGLIGENEQVIAIRDGIKINRRNGMAEDEKKFDFEIVEPGTCFDFQMEVILRQAFNSSLFDSFVQWIIYKLCGGNFALGARTGQGFGRCRLEDEKYFRFDFNNFEHVIKWLSKDYTIPATKVRISLPEKFKYNYKLFQIRARFQIKSSLIIGSYPGTPEEPDKAHIKSKKKDGSSEICGVIPGSSFRGAIRSRAERIAKTLDVYDEDKFHELFGWVEDKEGKKKAIKGRIVVEESQLDTSTYEEQIQYRIRIDRFTGGVMKNALFDSMPIWSKDGNKTTVELNLSIKDYKEWEAGLMLLVLKDLWNGDLPIGGEKGIGRGTLQGLEAEIWLDDKKVTIEQLKDGKLAVYESESEVWEETAAAKLEKLVKAFCNLTEEVGVLTDVH